MTSGYPECRATDGTASAVRRIGETLLADGRLAAVGRRHHYGSRGRGFAWMPEPRRHRESTVPRSGGSDDR